LAAIAVVVLATAGCGGSTTTLYTQAKTRACLQKAGIAVSSVATTSDFVANSATGGAFRAKLSDNFATVSFGLTQTDADNIDQAYLRFHAKNVGIDDVLRTQGNAVMLWHEHPSDADVSTITGCLKG
jgi:hypothetical protein